MSDLLELAAEERITALEDEQMDAALTTLLANYEHVTADKQKMSYLRFLLKHYAAKSHPWQACYKDNFKRFGPKTAGLCGVLKDTIRQNTHWRHGAPAGPHPDHPDSGSPGVGIAYADAAGSKQWHGHAGLKLSDDEAIALAALIDAAEQCDPCRVLLSLDEAPAPSEYFTSDAWREDFNFELVTA